MSSNGRLTMTIPEFAAAAGISKSLAFKLAKKDQLGVPVLRFGEKRMLLPRRAAEKLLLEGQNTQEEPHG